MPKMYTIVYVLQHKDMCPRVGCQALVENLSPSPGAPLTARLPEQTRNSPLRCAGRCRIGVWVKGGPGAYSIDGFCRRALCLGGFAERRAPQAGFKPAPTIGTFHSPVRQSFGSAQNVAQGTFSILSYLGRGGRTVALDPSGDAALC